MKRAMAFLAVLTGVLALGSCSTYRNTFKLTIEVEVDGERKIASSVYEREIYDNIGGVADRIRGTMPHLSLGKYGDIVLSFGGLHPLERQRTGKVVRQRPPYITENLTWQFPPFDDNMKPAQAIRYPARGGHISLPAGDLLSLPVFWRPSGVTDIHHFKRIWFHELATIVDPAVRPVRITIEPTRERLLYRIPDAPGWIKSWRLQFEEIPRSQQNDYPTFNCSPKRFETELGG